MATQQRSIAPIEVDAGNGPYPLGMSPQQFLRDYWQKKPLLIRNAFPDFESPIQPEDLAGLACEEGALARIVKHDRASDSWEIRNGPFAEDVFPAMPDHDWTVLVQDVDKWDPDVRALLASFDFLPRWRMDDIMVSFAARGGSVGAHIDNYDVFLLQGVGPRRWQIDTRKNPDESYRDDVPLRLLRHFDPDRDWVLNPGDMLYLPPGIPHHGIAEDHCLTISVGLRAPSSAELLDDYALAFTFDADERIRYGDPDLVAASDPYRIGDDALERAWTALQLLRPQNRDELGEWFGRFISRYRVADGMAPAPGKTTGLSIADSVETGTSWHRHPYSRLFWRQGSGSAWLFANGEVLPCPAKEAAALCALETVDAVVWNRIGLQGQSLLQQLADLGHFRPEDAE